MGNVLLLLATLWGAPPGPRTPVESARQFVPIPGVRVEVAAAEPEVVDPVAISFDERGRVFVAEYRDYPHGPPADQPPMSRIRLLEDKDSDGRFETSHVFADHVPFAQGVMAWRGGVLVTAAPHILFFRDTDGDGRADVREILFAGFTAGNPQLRVAHPQWGPDNWIYLTNGLSNGEVTRANDSIPTAANSDPNAVKSATSSPPRKPAKMAVSIQGSDFRFHPQRLEFEATTGFGQFGNTFDDWGNRFFCSNRNPVVHVILPRAALARNPFAVITATYRDAAPSGGEAKVYPIVETATTAYEHSGTHTAACGVTIYRGDWLSEWRGNVFVCEPTGHLITRSKMVPDGVSFVTERAAPLKDFLVSSDNWFRPVSLANGPDGALYVVDMYRQVIEHPQYMPKGLAETLNLRAGDQQGRIYRLRPSEGKPRPFVTPQNTAEQLALLRDANGWRRSLGQRLLVERQAKDALAGLEALLAHEQPLTRVHALWTLEGLGLLTARHVELALNDQVAAVREQGLRLSGAFLTSRPELLAALGGLAPTTAPREALEMALALGNTTHIDAVAILATLAERHGADPWISRALLTSTPDRAGAVLGVLLDRAAFREQPTGRLELVAQWAEVIGARGDKTEVANLLNRLGQRIDNPTWWQTAALAGLAKGLPRGQGIFGRISLAQLLQNPPQASTAAAANLIVMLRQSARQANDNNATIAERVAAIRLLPYLPVATITKALPQLLQPTQPGAIQTAALEAVTNVSETPIGIIVLDAWPGLAPSARAPALEFLLRRKPSTLALLDAMKNGSLARGGLSFEQRNRLLQHPDADIKQRALGIFGAASANRQKVLEQYKSILKEPGDTQRGAVVFKKTCAACHRVREEGHVVGPDISDVRNKTRETLLDDILDPNRAVEPRFTEYVIATHDGRVINGLVQSETNAAIILAKAEGKQEIIPRADIAAMKATGKSLMPEGVEKDITPLQMADLLAFLKQQNQ